MSAKAENFQRFKITVAYDGRPFAGWQSQPGGNTVQDLLNEALASICPDVSGVHGSGRTDAGVSADGQVAHFDAPAGWSMDSTAWRKAANTKLPPAIRVMHAEEVTSDFHARFSAVSKTYRYRICTSEVVPPLKAGLVWHRPHNFDLSKLEKVIALFEGDHDFRPFSAKRHDGHDADRDSTRTIFSSGIRESTSNELEIEFCGSGFLYKMVRILVGVSFEFHDGKRELDEIRKQLNHGQGFLKAPFCAPSGALRLVNVRYRT